VLHSTSGEVFDCCAHAHIGSCTRGCKGERALSFPQCSIKEKLFEAYRLSINEHNIKVKKNREILSKIIDCIFFCGNLKNSLTWT
jgi:hypothetical protein